VYDAFCVESMYFRRDARVLLVASGRKGFHVYLPWMFGTRWQASAVMAMITSSLPHCDGAVGVGSHITGLFSVHRELTHVRVVPVACVEDYVLRVTNPSESFGRGVALLTVFIEKDDVASLWW
jgi:hypothetical protein